MKNVFIFYWQYLWCWFSWYAIISTAKNIVISPDFLVWKFCGMAQFPHSFGRLARNYAETVPFHKISTSGNQVKLRYFSQCRKIKNQNCFFVCVLDSILVLSLFKIWKRDCNHSRFSENFRWNWTQTKWNMSL